MTLRAIHFGWNFRPAGVHVPGRPEGSRGTRRQGAGGGADEDVAGGWWPLRVARTGQIRSVRRQAVEKVSVGGGAVGRQQLAISGSAGGDGRGTTPPPAHPADVGAGDDAHHAHEQGQPQRHQHHHDNDGNIKNLHDSALWVTTLTNYDISNAVDLQ